MSRQNLDFDKWFDSIFLNYGQPMWVTTRSKLTENKNEVEDPYRTNYTKDGAYCFFDVPGFNKTNLQIDVEDGYIHIQGKKKFTGEETERNIYHKLKIGEGYNPDTIEATVEDGILTLFIPNYKKPESKKRISRFTFCSGINFN